MVRLDRAEVRLLLAAVTHPAGLNIDIFGLLSICGTDQGTFEVGYPDFEYGAVQTHRSFTNPLRAVAFFSRFRQKNDIGVDKEAALLREDDEREDNLRTVRATSATGIEE